MLIIGTEKKHLFENYNLSIFIQKSLLLIKSHDEKIKERISTLDERERERFVEDTPKN